MAASSRRLVQLLPVATSASAGRATSTGTSSNASASVSVNAGLATATGTAYDATISTANGTNANAGLASATGTSNNAATSVAPTAGLSPGTGTSYDAPLVCAAAQIATGTGTAYDTLINLGITDVDGAAGHEAELIEVQVSDSETGTGTDSEVTPSEPFSSSETGTATESESVFVSAPAATTTPRWIFVDGATEYAFPTNPSSTTEPVSEKTIVYSNTLGPSSKSIIFETQGDIQTLSWTGTTFTQAEYEALIDWFDKRNEFTLMDDLGRVFTIYVTDFEPKRKRSVEYPWLHEYDMKALVLTGG